MHQRSRLGVSTLSEWAARAANCSAAADARFVRALRLVSDPSFVGKDRQRSTTSRDLSTSSSSRSTTTTSATIATGVEVARALLLRPDDDKAPSPPSQTHEEQQKEQTRRLQQTKDVAAEKHCRKNVWFDYVDEKPREGGKCNFRTGE
jgi:uncharacterized protein (DUF2147 family)